MQTKIKYEIYCASGGYSLDKYVFTPNEAGDYRWLWHTTAVYSSLVDLTDAISVSETIGV